MAHPQAGRIVTDCLTVAGHREGEIAIHAARSLCEATHRSVCCIAGIHFEGVSKVEIQQIVRAARSLTEEVAGELGRRLRAGGG